MSAEPVGAGFVAARTFAGPRRRHGLHPERRSHLAALRRMCAGPVFASSTHATSRAPRSPPRRARRSTRRVGVAALTAGPGCHERHQRDHDGLAERVAGVRARRSGATGPVGPGLAAGAGPRADRRAGHEACRDVSRRRAHPGGVRRRAASWPGRPHRGPTFLDVPLDGWGPDGGRSTAAAVRPRSSRAPPPIPTTSRASPRWSPMPAVRF